MRLFVVIASLIAAAPAIAQNPKPVLPQPGRGIELKLYGRPETYRVTFAKLDQDSLWLWVDPRDPTPVALPRPIISELNAPAGTRRHPIQGAVIGGATMGALMLIVDATFGSMFDAVCESSGESCSVPVGAYAGAIGIGAAFGGAVGSLVKSQKWGPVISPTEWASSKASVTTPGLQLNEGRMAGAAAAEPTRKDGATTWFWYGVLGGTAGSVFGGLFVDNKAKKSTVSVTGIETARGKGAEYAFGYRDAYAGVIRSTRRKYALYGTVVGSLASYILTSAVESRSTGY
jgi:hypothetical protein